MEEKQVALTTEITSILDDLLGNTSLVDVTAERTQSSELPTGYYLCELEKSELTVSKSSGKPMVAMTFKVVEDGIGFEEGNDDLLARITLKGTANRKIFKYYVLSEERQVKSFVADMLKFEDTEGNPLLTVDCFSSTGLLEESIQAIVGLYVFMKVDTTKNDDGSVTSWKNMISWKRAVSLGLSN